jgi:hypothetical protein
MAVTATNMIGEALTSGEVLARKMGLQIGRVSVGYVQLYRMAWEGNVRLIGPATLARHPATAVDMRPIPVRPSFAV